jgi:hypothetical protein
MKWFLREALLATSLAALVVTLEPSWMSAMVRLWTAALIILAVSVYISWLLSVPLARAHEPSSARKPGELREMRDIEAANDFLIAVDYQLGPFLQRAIRDIAMDRLLTRRDIALDDQPMRARQVLGEEVWRLVNISTKDWSSASNLNHEQLAFVVTELENI